MKNEILKLHAEGKTYDEISKILGCSKSTVSYHCSDAVRNQSKISRNKNRKKQRKELKMKYGGKCSVCGYNRCLSSLHFHHKDQTTKLGIVGGLLTTRGKKVAYAEAKKCCLICSNCHGELHEGLITI